MFAGLLTVVLALLVLNALVAVVVIGRRHGAKGWLLALLLTGTTGVAVVAVLALPTFLDDPRILDVALVIAGLATLPAAVRAVHVARTDEERA